jgi:hypothetical protein
LRWDPPSADIPFGGSGTSELKDGEGRVLATLDVVWVALEADRPSPFAMFMVRMGSRADCDLRTAAELRSADGAVRVSRTGWATWVTGKEPARNEWTEFSAHTPWPSRNRGPVVLHPLQPDASLSQCRVRSGRR